MAWQEYEPPIEPQLVPPIVMAPEMQAQTVAAAETSTTVRGRTTAAREIWARATIVRDVTADEKRMLE
jgi:hypothetical protein